MGMCANSLRARLRLPRPHPLLRRPPGHQPRRAADDQERHLHARGGLTASSGSTPTAGCPTPEVRRSRRLVISSRLDGRELRVRLLLVPLPGRQHPARGEADRHPVAGRVRSRRDAASTARWSRRNVYAPNHQHFFNVRLDFDLDGTANTVQQVDVVPDRAGADNPFENAFRAKATTLETEKQARGHLNLRDGADVEGRQPARARTRVGEPVGYRFLPGDNAFPFASPNAWWRKRAGFVNYHVWVTPFRDDEQYARRRLPEPEHRRRRPGRRGPSRTGRSRTPTWCCGTRSATRTSRGRRTTR